MEASKRGAQQRHISIQTCRLSRQQQGAHLCLSGTCLLALLAGIPDVGVPRHGRLRLHLWLFFQIRRQGVAPPCLKVARTSGSFIDFLSTGRRPSEAGVNTEATEIGSSIQGLRKRNEDLKLLGSAAAAWHAEIRHSRAHCMLQPQVVANSTRYSHCTPDAATGIGKLSMMFSTCTYTRGGGISSGRGLACAAPRGCLLPLDHRGRLCCTPPCGHTSTDAHIASESSMTHPRHSVHLIEKGNSGLSGSDRLSLSFK